MGLLSGKWFVVGPGREPTPEVTRRQLESRLTFGTEAEGRYELDDRGLRLYDPDGVLVLDLRTLTGQAFFGDQSDAYVLIDPTRSGTLLFHYPGMDDPASIVGGNGTLIMEPPADIGNPRAVLALTQGTGAAVLVQPVLQLIEQTTPTTPDVQRLILYAKDKAGTSALYMKNDAGTEYELGPIGTHTHTESEITDFAHTHGAGDLPAAPPTNVFLGRALVQAAAWSNASGDGWEDWGGASPLSVTVTKAAAATRLLVEYGFSVFRTTAGGAMNYAIHDSVTATRYDQITGFINGVGEHEGFTGQALISGLSAASHTLKLQIDNTTAGGNVETAVDDYGHIKVSEVA